MKPMDREAVMHKIADDILANVEEYGTIESTDNGKSIAMGMADAKGIANMFKYYAGWPTKLEATTTPIGNGFLSYSKNHPVGVCGQIIPWNFPLVMCALKLGPVLATGCTSVLKTAEQTPLSALRLG